MMVERPIRFNAQKIRAILAGAKTQTRQLVNWAPKDLDTLLHRVKNREVCCPCGKTGDRLWVQEPWMVGALNDADGPRQLSSYTSVYFAADAANMGLNGAGRLRQSRHMPRWASRITLEITSVHLERLHDISELDAIAEGAHGGHGSIPGYAYAATPYEHYRWLWELNHGTGSWDLNPWVWVVEFNLLDPKQNTSGAIT